MQQPDKRPLQGIDVNLSEGDFVRVREDGPYRPGMDGMVAVPPDADGRVGLVFHVHEDGQPMTRDGYDGGPYLAKSAESFTISELDFETVKRSGADPHERNFDAYRASVLDLDLLWRGHAERMETMLPDHERYYDVVAACRAPDRESWMVEHHPHLAAVRARVDAEGAAHFKAREAAIDDVHRCLLESLYQLGRHAGARVLRLLDQDFTPAFALHDAAFEARTIRLNSLDGIRCDFDPNGEIAAGIVSVVGAHMGLLKQGVRPKPADVRTVLSALQRPLYAVVDVPGGAPSPFAEPAASLLVADGEPGMDRYVARLPGDEAPAILGAMPAEARIISLAARDPTLLRGDLGEDLPSDDEFEALEGRALEGEVAFLQFAAARDGGRASDLFDRASETVSVPRM